MKVFCAVLSLVACANAGEVQCTEGECSFNGASMIQHTHVLQKRRDVDLHDEASINIAPPLEYSEYEVDEGELDDPIKNIVVLEDDEGLDNSAAWLAAHNSKRALHGAPALTWNAASAADALKWVTSNSGHSQSYGLPPPVGPAGENLAANTRSTIDIPWAVGAWYSEIKDCGPLPGCKKGSTGVTGHFTAMIWKGAKELGCAHYRDGSSGWTRYICRYKGDDTLNCNTPNMGGCYTSHVPALVNAPATTPAPTVNPSAAPTTSPATTAPAPAGSGAAPVSQTPLPTSVPATSAPATAAPTPAPQCLVKSTSWQCSGKYCLSPGSNPDRVWAAGGKWCLTAASSYCQRSDAGWCRGKCNCPGSCAHACGRCPPPNPTPPPTPTPRPTPAPTNPTPHPTPAPPTPSPTPYPASAARNYALQTSGKCAQHVKTIEECSAAGAFLKLRDTTASSDRQTSVWWDPPYCYFESGRLKFNGGGNTGGCSRWDKCVCSMAPTPPPTPPAPIAPSSCSFESGLCFWMNEKGDEFDWTRKSGRTASCGTGPSSAVDGSYYVYIETSCPRKRGDMAELRSPPLLTTGTTKLKFSYSMYGSTIGSLEVNVKPAGGTWSTIWQQSGNKGSAWKAAELDLGSYQSPVEIQFIGIRGSSYRGDIALDKIEFL